MYFALKLFNCVSSRINAPQKQYFVFNSLTRTTGHWRVSLSNLAHCFEPSDIGVLHYRTLAIVGTIGLSLVTPSDFDPCTRTIGHRRVMQSWFCTDHQTQSSISLCYIDLNINDFMCPYIRDRSKMSVSRSVFLSLCVSH